MAANVGRKTRIGVFGIALCFLAALFFIEAKTTWAVVGGQSSVGIASAKALGMDPSQKAEMDSEPARSPDRGLTLLADLSAILMIGLLGRPQWRSQALFEFVPHLVYHRFGHERSVRPPPSR